MRRLLVTAALCSIFTWCSASFAQTPSGTITAAPEMQKLLNAMTGSWSMKLSYAPSGTRSSEGTGTGHVVFRPGPGGLSLIEDEYSKDSTGEQFGLSVTWWDDVAKGFHALWCDNHLPTGCIIMSKLAHWEGDQFVLGDEFERDGRKYDFREVVLDLTDRSYRQQLSQGLRGGELKQIASIQANREPQGGAQPKTVFREAKLHMPGPDVQNLMLGTWSTQIRYAPTPEMSKGGTGEGTEIWRPGPGGLSVVEEEHEKNAKGETNGFSVGWWDEKAGGQRFIWCADDVPQGCVVPNNVAKWEGERMVFREDTEEGGRKITHAEIFSDITPHSFTQLLQQGEAGKALTNTVTILAKRKPDFSAVPQGELQTSGAESKPEIQKLADILAGRWSGVLTTEPGSREVGRADEIWRVTPGGLTLTEENRLSTSKGDSYDFAAIWWNSKAKKYEGIWCAETNDEGCNGFQASLESNQVIMRGEWEQSGKRRAWHEVFSRPNDSESIQTLDVGGTESEMRRVSAIHASRTQDSIANALSGTDAEQGFRNLDNDSEATKLVALTNEWTDAINSRDRLKLDALMASDFALYRWNGELGAPRAKWLDNLFNHIKITKNTLTDVAPQLYGDFGVVTSVGDWIGTFDGRPFASKCVVADTWRKIDSQWKVVRRTSHCYSEDSGRRVNWDF